MERLHRSVAASLLGALGLLTPEECLALPGVQGFGPPAALNSNAATDSGGDFDPQVTTDRAGSWVAVWFSSDSLGGTIGADFDVLVARSSDAGATWTAPAALHGNATSDSGADFAPEVTTDGAGSWLAVWFSSDSLGGTIGTDFDVLVARSTDAGASWTAPAALNTNAATDVGDERLPQLTTDGAGRWLAVWESTDSLGGTIGDDFDILMARSTDAGATWTDPVALNSNAATDSGDDVLAQATTDAAGRWVALWYSVDSLGGSIGTDPDVLVARSTDAGATWTAPVALNTNASIDSGVDFSPQLTTDGAGSWVALWSSTDSLGGTIGTDTDVLLARSTDAGATWTAPAALDDDAANDSGNDFHPQLTTDGAGNWIALWYSDDTLGGTLGNDRDVLMASSPDAGVTWSAVAPLDTGAGSDSGDETDPQLTTDGAGNWIATFDSTDSLGGTIGFDGDVLFASGIPPTVPALAVSALTALAALLLAFAARPRRG